MNQKALTPDDPEFLPVQYDLTEARLKKLAKEYDPKQIPTAEIKGDDAYTEIHNKVMAIVTVRTNIEKKRKELKSDALAWGKKVDGEAKRLTTAVEEMEAPWREIKINLDKKEEREAEAARLAEESRLEEIEDRIFAINSMTNGLLNVDSAAIQARIDKAQGIQINEDAYGEYLEAAQLAHGNVLNELQTALEQKVQFEEGQAALAKQQAEQAEAQRKIDEQQAEIDKVKREQDAAARAELERREKEERQAREKAEAAQREEEAKRIKAEQELQDKKDAEDRELAEKESREQDKRHKTKINKAASEAIQLISGIGEAKTKVVIKAIADGKIPNITINY